mgnify:FL=1
MTDRHAGYIVVLDGDVRADDAQPLIAAMECLRGVVKVTPIVADVILWMAQERERARLTQRLWDALQETR